LQATQDVVINQDSLQIETSVQTPPTTEEVRKVDINQGSSESPQVEKKVEPEPTGMDNRFSTQDQTVTPQEQAGQRIETTSTVKAKWIRGVVTKFDRKKGYGSIKAEDGKSLSVNAIDVEGWGQSLKAKDKVEFTIVEVPLGWEAKEVKILSAKLNKALPVPPDIQRRSISFRSDRFYKEALAAKEQGDLPRARKLFEEAIRSGPHLNVFQAYAAMEEKDGSIESALRVLEKGIQKFPTAGGLYNDYGMLLRRRRDLVGAAEILRKGIQAAPDFAKQLHWSLASILIDLDDANLQEAAFHAEEAKKLGMPLQDDPRYKKLRLITEPNIGRKAFDFFTDVGFDIRVEEFTNNYADLLIISRQAEYTESYDLKGQILARCFFRKIQKQTDIQSILQTLRRPSYKNLNNDIGFLVLEDVTPWRDALYRIIENNREALVPIDNSILARSKVEDVMGLLRQVLDQWLSRRDLFQDRFPVSGRRFFGREAELHNLMRNIDDGQHVGIYGLRKVGKTSLLYQLQEKRPHDLVVYVDLQDIAGKGVNHCAYLYWEIARRLYEVLNHKQESELAINHLKLTLGSKSSYKTLHPYINCLYRNFCPPTNFGRFYLPKNSMATQ
jgi:cold shock CspA family protein